MLNEEYVRSNFNQTSVDSDHSQNIAVLSGAHQDDTLQLDTDYIELAEE